MLRTTEKLEKILFYVFLFLIPFQIRATISWQGIEWSSVFLYFTDILLVGVFILAAVNNFHPSTLLRANKIYWLLALFFLVAAISLFGSINLENSVYRLIKLAEFIGLYVYIMYRRGFLGLNSIFRVILASGVFQAILAIVQFYKQSSLGLKFIEAGKYLPGEPGVATFVSGTEKIMRAYGSFPHPNVLSAFLLLAIFCFYALWLKSEKSQVPNRQLPVTGYRLPVTSYLLPITSYFLLVFALFLTFSRGTIMIFVFVSFVFFVARFFQLRELYHTDERLAMGKKMMILVLFFVVFSVFSTIMVLPYFKTRFTEISVNEEAIDLRFFYNKMAISMVRERPRSGIGIGNFADYSREYPAILRAANKLYNEGGLTDPEVPEWLYQPTHNIYLLIAAEISVFGALVFIVFLLINLIRSIRPIKPKELSDLYGPMIFLFIGFVILGLNDHYFWTLQSGGLVFWISLALIENSYMENGK